MFTPRIGEHIAHAEYQTICLRRVLDGCFRVDSMRRGLWVLRVARYKRWSIDKCLKAKQKK